MSLLQRVVNVIEQFMLHRETGDLFGPKGRAELLPRVRAFLEKNAPIEFVMPAFPFKSPSKKKVLGILPDFGEYYALFVLNALCDTIKSVYEPGAFLTIVSDGFIYHDLVGVSLEDFRAYSKEIRSMGSEFHNLRFSCLKDLLSEAEFASWTADQQAFLDQQNEGFDLDAELETNDNLLQVYRGYLIFMRYDLEPQFEQSSLSNSQKKKRIRDIARQLICRGNVFSELVRRRYPDHVRLSIHCHDNRGPKYAISIAPSKFRTPWHNCTLLTKEGKLETLKVHEVKENSRVVMRNGRPWMMVEDDPDLVFKGYDLTFEPILPFGIKLQFNNNPKLENIPQQQLRKLTLKFGLVLIRGVENIESAEQFDKSTSAFGQVQSWFFGNVLVLKYNPAIDINNVLSKEAMPMHFDGLFKLDENGMPLAPLFQYFFCKVPSGTTLFTDTRLFLDQFRPLEHRKWKCFTPKNASFGGKPLELDIFQKHPETHWQVLRYHEPWEQEKTQFNPTHVEILAPEGESWNQRLTDCMYNRRFCLFHDWQQGDVVIADNYSLLHSRLAFADSARELWRIHFN
ncbi:Pyoverdine biosynthesis [Balamuthia mandrillaris]